MEEARVACLYAYGCQRANILKAGQELLNFIEKPNHSEEEVSRICSILRKLEPYQSNKLIGTSVDGCRFLSRKSQVRSYWLGSDSSITLSHNFSVLLKIKRIRESLDGNLPQEVVARMLNCLVSVGEVIRVRKRKLSLLNRTVLVDREGFFFGIREEGVDRGFVEEIEVGELVSIHLRIARERISKDEAESLKEATVNCLRILKKA